MNPESVLLGSLVALLGVLMLVTAVRGDLASFIAGFAKAAP